MFDNPAGLPDSSLYTNLKKKKKILGKTKDLKEKI